MRADRLVAALLLLQARGRMTAAELAAELRCRCARRGATLVCVNLEALAMAGVPVYAQAGRGGGWSLVGGARTDLTGLTAAAARSLFLLMGGTSADGSARSALRKLVQALPEPFRASAQAAGGAVRSDPVPWSRNRPHHPPHLDDVRHAIVDGVALRLTYTDRSGTSSERVVTPLGVVDSPEVRAELARIGRELVAAYDA